jgi:YfiH family protein
VIARFSLDSKTGTLATRIPLAHDEHTSPPFRALISLAAAGNMHFQRRDELPFRQGLFSVLGIDERRVFSLVQKHTKDVVIVHAGRSPDAFTQTIGDGLVTDLADAILTVTVADCLPIFIIDAAHGAFGIVHSGWKGTGIAIAAIERMEKEYGTRKKDVRAVIGPGIDSCCYDVDEDRARIFSREIGADTILRRAGVPYLDLKRANVLLLERAGVNDIIVCDDCTKCTPALSSFRRDGSTGFSAMIAVIGREW